jgi:hypothetical protein
MRKRANAVAARIIGAKVAFRCHTVQQDRFITEKIADGPTAAWPNRLALPRTVS